MLEPIKLMVAIELSPCNTVEGFNVRIKLPGIIPPPLETTLKFAEFCEV